MVEVTVRRGKEKARVGLLRTHSFQALVGGATSRDFRTEVSQVVKDLPMFYVPHCTVKGDVPKGFRKALTALCYAMDQLGAYVELNGKKVKLVAYQDDTG